MWKTTQNSVGCCCITGPPMQRRSPRRREEEFPSSGATDDQSRTFCGRCEMSSKFKTGQAVEYCGLIAPLGPYVIAPFCRNEMASLRHPNEAHARAARESGPPPGWDILAIVVDFRNHRIVGASTIAGPPQPPGAGKAITPA